jgi:hypothetical protein
MRLYRRGIVSDHVRDTGAHGRRDVLRFYMTEDVQIDEQTSRGKSGNFPVIVSIISDQRYPDQKQQKNTPLRKGSILGERALEPEDFEANASQNDGKYPLLQLPYLLRRAVI